MNNQLSKFILNTGAGLLSAIINLIYTVSMALLVFGSDPILLSAGLTITIISAGVVSIVLAKNSCFSNTVAMPQDTSAIIFLFFISALITKMHAENIGIDPLPTIMIGMIISGIFVGIILYAVGKYQLGNSIFFIPYTVVGGFLAGTG